MEANNASKPQPSIDDLRSMLDRTNKKEPVKVATLNKKDGTIDVTDEVVELLSDPITKKVIEDSKSLMLEGITAGVKEVGSQLESDIQKTLNETTKKIAAEQKSVRDEFDALSADIRKTADLVRPIEIRTENNTWTPAEDRVFHEKFETLLRIVASKLPVFMVGPAGTGKTAGAEAVAEALGLDFYAISVGSQTSKSDIFGYKDAQGVFHETAFYKAYVNGGVFLLDEADAGNANVLVGLNAALSNGYVFFPNGVMTKMHDDFRMIATANTFGNGASRQYVGRNQLDAATLDRFTVLVWDIDLNVEEAIAVSESPNFGKRWMRVVRAVRSEAIDQLDLRAVVSPRATLRGARLLETGLTYEDVVEVALLANMPEAERDQLRNVANAEWAKGEARRGRPPGSKNKPKQNTNIDELVSVFDAAEDA